MDDTELLAEMRNLIKKKTTHLTRPNAQWPEVSVRFCSDAEDARRFIDLLYVLKR